MNDRSYIVDFFTSFYQTEIEFPQQHADANTKLSWTQPFTDNPPLCSSHACAGETRLKQAQKHPDIVAILEESTFDPTMLEVCTLPICAANTCFRPTVAPARTGR